ncbi:MAG: porin [Alphaproteobacteria bacterium]
MSATALIGAALLAKPAPAQEDAAEPRRPLTFGAATGIELELRGYAQFGLAGIIGEPEYFGLDRSGVDAVIGTEIGVPRASDAFFGNRAVFGSDSEVHFRGRTVLDNGLGVAFRAELELEDDAEVDRDADTIDEVYAQVSGAFGRFQFGMQDGVADQMIISAPNVFSQFTISSIDMNPFELYADPALNGVGLPGGPFPPSRTRFILGITSFLDTSPDFTADFTKIIYFTPRIYGIQLGVSFAPNPCRNDTGLDVANDAVFGCGRADAFGANYWEIGGNVAQEFTGFGVGLSGSYGQGDSNPLVPELSERPYEWHVGGELFFDVGQGKVTLGGAYKNTEGIDALNLPFFDARSRHVDAGVTYGTGPWEIGGAWGKADSVFDGSDEELTLVIGGFSYDVGPGIQVGLGVIYGDAAAESPDLPQDETGGTSVFSELDLRF